MSPIVVAVDIVAAMVALTMTLLLGIPDRQETELPHRVK